jgi:hypothetical protein
MKGIIFTEFVEWVEATWSDDVANSMFDGVSLESGGAYTSVGSYSHSELIALVTELANVTGRPAAELVTAHGQAIFRPFVAVHPWVLTDMPDLFSFLERLESYIHTGARKLYPGATPPRFESERRGDSELCLEYRSHRPFSAVAVGLIHGAAAHFAVQVTVDEGDRNRDGSIWIVVRLIRP